MSTSYSIEPTMLVSTFFKKVPSEIEVTFKEHWVEHNDEVPRSNYLLKMKGECLYMHVVDGEIVGFTRYNVNKVVPMLYVIKEAFSVRIVSDYGFVLGEDPDELL